MLGSVFTLSVVNSLIYGLWSTKQPTSAFRTLVKTAAILCLAFYVYLSGGPFFLVAALCLSALGDFFLSRDGDRMFLAGMVAFFAAHLAYIPLFVSLGYGGEMILNRWPIVVLLSVFAIVLFRLLWPHLGALRTPVAVYFVAIGAMFLSALGLPTTGSAGLVLIGALSFIISDSVLALEKFYFVTGAFQLRITPYVVWAFYWAAQVLIAFGTLQHFA
ncbi:MAG: putative membrane protein YhhN [Paracoccaceae bacterium]